MIIRAAILALVAFPAAAQDVRFVPDPDRLVIHNRVTSGYPEDIARNIRTPFGAVRLLFRITRNSTCAGANGQGCPDTVQVLQTPPGYIAAPLVVEIPETESAEIILQPFNGM